MNVRRTRGSSVLGVLDRLGRRGAQVLCPTRSPLLTAMPGATVLQLGDRGVEQVDWQELDLVDHWRRYLRDPHARSGTPMSGRRDVSGSRPARGSPAAAGCW